MKFTKKIPVKERRRGGWIINSVKCVIMSKAKSIDEIINIDRIENDTVVLKSGGLRKVLLVSGVSFDLKSEEEKNMVIYGYQDFLNALDFSIQQIVHSRRINIDNYLKTLGQAREKEGNKMLKQLIADYHQFVSEFVSKNPIMSKTFFVVVPYDSVNIVESGQSAIKKVTGLFKFKRGRKKKEVDKEKDSNEGKMEDNLRKLGLRVDEVVDGLHRLGIRAVPLSKPELIELFYSFYN